MIQTATFLSVLLLSNTAFAYVGPGPALSMMGSAVTLIIGIGLALFMVLFYPLRLLWKKHKKNKSTNNSDSPS
ncbi:MAG: hypothetical protein ACN2B6_05990 [Rickettsiales bacterium]